VTLQQPENPPFIDGDNPVTEPISVASPAPVFVDTTGRRSRLLRRIAYGFGALVVLYGGLIVVSLVGGPVPSSAVLPLPGLEPAGDAGDQKPAQPSPTPTPAHSATPVFVADALPHRAATAATAARLESAKATSPAARPAAKPSPTRKPAATTGTPKVTPATSPPIESTTLPAPPATVPTTPATTPAAPSPPPVSTGGQGGGAESPTAAPKPTVETPITEPAKTDPAKAEPAKAEPAKADPAKTQPAKTEPTKAEA